MLILGMYVCMYNIEVGKNERFKLSILSYPILSYRRGEAGRLGARSRKFCLLSNVFRTYASRHLPAECQRRRGGAWLWCLVASPPPSGFHLAMCMGY